MTREELKEMYEQIENDSERIRSLKASLEDSIVDYRIKSVYRVLDYIHTKSFGGKEISNKELNNLTTHCLNKLNGNIDGIELVFDMAECFQES
ncbi:MAG: hypothetical protein RR405_03485 [Clostridia bacterium]